MNTSYGWIKLYRCLLDDPLWQCSTNEQKIILITLLLMANHAERKWEWNGRPYVCQPGQMITSLNSIHEKCGKKISIRKIQLALIRFEKMGFLLKQSSRVNTLITICNWSTYQATETPDVKDGVTAPSHKCHSSVGPALTNKNEKNINKHGGCDYLILEDEDMEGYTPEEIKDPGLAAWLAAP